MVQVTAPGVGFAQAVGEFTLADVFPREAPWTHVQTVRIPLADLPPSQADALRGRGVDATDTGSGCVEPVTDCPCSDTCVVYPIRVTHPSGGVELYPSERSRLDGIHQAMSFEGWAADGTSTCEQDRGQRWLLLVGAEDQ